jgi:hypothetical protein
MIRINNSVPVLKDGVRNPAKGAGRVPDNLEFVFGQLPSNKEKEMHSFMRDADTIKAINVLLGEKSEKQRKLAELEGKQAEYTSYRMEAQSLLDQLCVLGDSPSASVEEHFSASRFSTARELGRRELLDNDYDGDGSLAHKRLRK